MNPASLEVLIENDLPALHGGGARGGSEAVCRALNQQGFFKTSFVSANNRFTHYQYPVGRSDIALFFRFSKTGFIAAYFYEFNSQKLSSWPHARQSFHLQKIRDPKNTLKSETLKIII